MINYLNDKFKDSEVNLRNLNIVILILLEIFEQKIY